MTGIEATAIMEDTNSATPTQVPNQQRIETLFRRLTWNSQKTVLRSIIEIGQLEPALLTYAMAVACIRGKNLPIRLKLIEELGRIGLHARASTGIVLVELMRVEQPAIIRRAAWDAACAMRGCGEEPAGRPLDSSV